jgi:DNA-binding CsgD family transcriptional regulator
MHKTPFVLVDENDVPLAAVIHHDQSKWPELSAREVQVALMLARGLTCKEIAAAVGFNVKTADTHRMNILRKLGVDNTVKLCLIAVKRGAVTP